MNYLIIINTKYPYKSGETFLESEIRETASEFDKIIIYPIDILTKDKQTRNLPSNNIETVPFEHYSFTLTKGIAAVKAVLTMFKFKSKTFAYKFYDSYFEQHSIDQAKKIIKKLKQIDFKQEDTVILYSYWFYTGARIGIELKKYFDGKVAKVTVISRAHRFDVYEFENDKNYLPRREFLLENSDKVYVCSEDGERYLKAKYQSFVNKIKTSRLGTYDHGYRGVKSRSVFEIVTCSRVTEIKRLSHIVEALSILDKKNYNFKWNHIGDGPLFDEVKGQTEKSLHKNKYEFLGRKANKDVYEYYSNNDINLFLNVSTSEGLPVSIMEAISFGIPVIATDVGGTSEIIMNDKNGYLLNKDFETDDLVNLIMHIMDMSDVHYKRICNESRTIWENWFDAKKNYVDFVKNIKSL